VNLVELTPAQIERARCALEILMADASPEDFDEIEQTYNALGVAIGLPAQQLYSRDT
jgi:hypothetical protein